MRLDKPISTFKLTLANAFGHYILPKNVPTLSVLAIFICGVFLMRSAGCVIHEHADRHIDGKVKRTTPTLSTGRATPREAKWLFIVSFLFFFISPLFKPLYYWFICDCSHFGIYLSLYETLYPHLPQFS